MITTAQNLERIISARDVLRTTAVNFGIALSDAELAELAEAFGTIINRGTVNVQIKEGESYSILRGYYPGGTVKAISDGSDYTLQAKGEVTPTKSKQTVTADSGYYGLSSVIVNAIPANFQDVSDVTATAPDVLLGKVIVTADGKVVPGSMPNNGAVSKTLDTSTAKYTFTSGYYAGGTIDIALEEKSAAPTKAQQTITPASGKVLSKVIIAAIPDKYQDVSGVTATAAQVLSGEVIVGADGKPITGTMPNNGAVNAQIKEGESYTVERGYYDGGVIQGIAGGGNYALQAKGPIVPTDTEQIITPDSGFYGLSSVKIAAAAAAPAYTRAESTKF